MSTLQDEVFAKYMAASHKELPMPRTCLLVSYLPRDMDEQELGNLFGRFGTVTSITLKRNRAGLSNCNAFVNMSDDARLAKYRLNGHSIRGKSLRVGYWHPQAKSSSLFVANIPRFYSNKALRAVFQRFGTINEVKVVRDRATGMPTGVGFVNFEMRSCAEAALNEMMHKKLKGSTKPLVIKLENYQRHN